MAVGIEDSMRNTGVYYIGEIKQIPEIVDRLLTTPPLRMGERRQILILCPSNPGSALCIVINSRSLFALRGLSKESCMFLPEERTITVICLGKFSDGEGGVFSSTAPLTHYALRLDQGGASCLSRRYLGHSILLHSPLAGMDRIQANSPSVSPQEEFAREILFPIYESIDEEARKMSQYAEVQTGLRTVLAVAIGLVLFFMLYRTELEQTHNRLAGNR